MYEIKVQGMSCGGCVNSITKAIKGRDPQGEVEVDLSSQKVHIKSQKDLEELAALIEGLGFSVLEKRKIS